MNTNQEYSENEYTNSETRKYKWRKESIKEIHAEGETHQIWSYNHIQRCTVIKRRIISAGTSRKDTTLQKEFQKVIKNAEGEYKVFRTLFCTIDKNCCLILTKRNNNPIFTKP